jgi:hypothetical protein
VAALLRQAAAPARARASSQPIYPETALWLASCSPIADDITGWIRDWQDGDAARA